MVPVLMPVLVEADVCLVLQPVMPSHTQVACTMQPWAMPAAA